MKKTRECSSEVSLKKTTDDPIENFRIEYRYFLTEAVITNKMVEMTVTNISVTSSNVLATATHADAAVTNRLVTTTNMPAMVTNMLVTVTNMSVAVTNMINPHQIGGEFVPDDLTTGRVLTFNTGTIKLTGEYDKRWVVDLFGSTYRDIPLREERIMGIWLKLSGCGPDGVPVVRDICIPKDLYKQEVWSNTVPMLTATVVTGSETNQPVRPEMYSNAWSRRSPAD